MKIVGGIYRKQHGFTIVELLIVIVVIAILAALAIVAFNGVQARANNSKTESAVTQCVKFSFHMQQKTATILLKIL